MTVTLGTPHGPREFFYLLTDHGRLAMVVQKTEAYWLVRRFLHHVGRWSPPQKLWGRIVSSAEQPSLDDGLVRMGIAVIPPD